MAKIFPEIGAWFEDIDTHQLFEIVAIDEKNETIEVQFKEGEIGEFDLEAWVQLQIVSAAAPEDAAAAFEDSTLASNVYSGADSENLIVSNPLESIEPEPFDDSEDL